MSVGVEKGELIMLLRKMIDETGCNCAVTVDSYD